jgi:NTE family protein
MIRQKKNIGLALGGGAVLGAAHIGVLRALEELKIPISFIAGTSIGAFVSAFVAFGKRWDEIEELANELKWLDVSSISLSQFGLLSNKKMGKLFKDTLGDVTFDQAKIPVAMIATDISNGEKVIIKDGEISTAVMASTCVPGVFVPIEREGRLLVDGGVVENVPITPLKEMGADFIIGVDLISKRSSRKPKNIIEVILNTVDFTLMAATKLQTEEANILISPDLSAYNMVNTDNVKDLIKTGYEEAINTMGS